MARQLIGERNGLPLDAITWEDTGLYEPKHEVPGPVFKEVFCPACGNPNAHRMGVDTNWVYFCPADHIVITREGTLTIQEI